MARGYRMTPARRSALRKAQLASARKRKGRGTAIRTHVGRNRGKYIGGFVTIAGIGGAVGAHKASGSTLRVRKSRNVSSVTGKQLPGGIRRSGGGRTVGVIAAASKTKVTMSYTFGRTTPAKVHVGRPANKPDHDSIPLYNPKTERKGWPHVNPAQARKINQRLREKGMLA